MFENMINFFKKIGKKEGNKKAQESSKETAKERLHLVLMQDRANVSVDFLELMKQEIIEVIKKYIEVDEKEIDVRLTNKENEDGTNGAPALYANIPILNIKNETKKSNKNEEVESKKEEKTEVKKEKNKEEINKEEKNSEPIEIDEDEDENTDTENIEDEEVNEEVVENEKVEIKSEE